jgi:hypothetical protein
MAGLFGLVNTFPVFVILKHLTSTSQLFVQLRNHFEISVLTIPSFFHISNIRLEINVLVICEHKPRNDIEIFAWYSEPNAILYRLGLFLPPVLTE